MELVLISYNAAISACRKGKQPDKTVELFEDMLRKGLEPNRISCNAVISAREKGKQPTRPLSSSRTGSGTAWNPKFSVAMRRSAHARMARSVRLQCGNQRMGQGLAMELFADMQL